MAAAQTSSMIFHIPFSLSTDSQSASRIRPNRMLEAFRENGHDVHLVAGSPQERSQQIRSLKQKIREGLHFNFVYSEASTAPTGTGQPVSRHTSFTRDINFLRFCQQRNIPVGLFYRDVYWQFDAYAQEVPWPLSALLRALYRWDLCRYRQGNFLIYLPSRNMTRWVPIIGPDRIRTLPPGLHINDAAPAVAGNEKLRLLYVGGLGNYYRMHAMLAAVAGRADVELTVCTRAVEWQRQRNEYEPLLAENIRVVHASGTELHALYAATDICLLVLEPIEYRDFAVPFKLFEYLGYGKPAIASESTYAAEFILQNEIGWAVSYQVEDISQLIARLASDRQLVHNTSTRARAVRAKHTWQARAAQVARDLTTKN